MSAPPRGVAAYREVLAVPGAAVFVTAGAVARLPISMVGIGIVLLVTAEYGSYAAAGLVAAAYSVTAAVCSPLLARAVDRRGQARVMRPAVAVHVTGIAALLVLAGAHAPVAALAAAAGVAGASVGSVGALVRARWLHVLAGQPGSRLEGRVHTAFSLESVLDEVVFVAGPLVVTVLATAVSPVLGLAAAAVAVASGAAVLLAQRRTEPPPTGSAPAAGTAVLRARGMVPLLVVFLAAGAVFGAIEVVTVAYTEQRGVPAAAGVVLAVYAVGSLLAGLGYGAVHWSGEPARRFRVAALGFAAGMLPMLLVTSVPALAVVLFLAGFAVSPTLIAGNALVRSLVDHTRLTEGLTWVSTAIGIGIAAGAAVGGQWVDAAGATSALTLPVVCGAVAALAVLGLRRTS